MKEKFRHKKIHKIMKGFGERIFLFDFSCAVETTQLTPGAPKLENERRSLSWQKLNRKSVD
jgi:hypothetical protein